MNRIDYDFYLRSPEWRVVRRIALDFADYRCQTCNHNKDLQVHHRTYKNIGSETLSDVVVLCEKCHKLFHKIKEGKEDKNLISGDAPIQNQIPNYQSKKYPESSQRSEKELRLDFKDIIEDSDDFKGFKGVNRLLIRKMMVNLNIDLKYHTKLCDVLDDNKFEDIESCIDDILH